MPHCVPNRALSEVPHTETVVGVRIGLIGDKFVVNPTTTEMEDSKLDLMLAGSETGILMIEVVPLFFYCFQYTMQYAYIIITCLTWVFLCLWTCSFQGYCDFLPEEKLLQAIEVGQVVI